MAPDAKRKLSPRKILFYLIEEYVRDIMQGQNFAPHLLELIMKPTDHVKEELSMVLVKMNQFRRFVSKITKIRVCTFQMSRKSKDSRRRPTQPVSPVSLKPIMATQTQNKFRNMRF